MKKLFLALMLIPAPVAVYDVSICEAEKKKEACECTGKSPDYPARRCDGECAPMQGWKTCRMTYCPRCAGGDQEDCDAGCTCK